MSINIVYGTAWKEDKTEKLVSQALATGFRAIDTANQRKHYNEVGVGNAIKEFLKEHNRSELFIQTKFTSVTGQDHRLPYDPNESYTTQVEQSFNSSLEHLGVSFVDSFILHGPMTYPGLVPADKEIYQAMEKLYEQGKAKAIGLSNISIDQLKEFLLFAKIKPAFVQNRCFAETKWDLEVREFCKKKGIIYQGFSLLTANPHVVNSSIVKGIANAHDKTPQQIVFSFARSIGILPLTGTTDQVHMYQDLESIKIALSQDEVNKIMRISY